MEITKKDVENIIEKRKENTFLTHLGQSIYCDYVYYGEVKRDEIIIWSHESVHILKLTPVFTFKFNASNHLVDIKTAINPFDKCLIIVVTLLIGFLLLPQNINPYTNNYWVIAGLLLTFFTLIFWVFRKVYQSKVQDQLEELYEILDI